jgi:hypothetical protein
MMSALLFWRGPFRTVRYPRINEKLALSGVLSEKIQEIQSLKELILP